MIILWLAAFPLIMAFALLLVRRVRLIAAPLAAATLAAVAILATTQGNNVPLTFLGRTLDLSPLQATGLTFVSGLMACLMLYAYRVDQGPLVYPLALASVGLFAAALIVQTSTLSILCLEAAAFLAVMMIPSTWEDAPLTAMRTLMILALAGPLLLLGPWGLESHALSPDAASLPRLGAISMALGTALALAIVPLNVWLPSVFRRGTAVSSVLLSVALSAVALLRLEGTLRLADWPESQAFFMNLALNAGMLSAVLGSLTALTQRSVSGALAYAAAADMGIVLIGLGLGGSIPTSAAILHLAYRGIAITVICMAIGVLRPCLEGDDLQCLEGAYRRAPLSVLALLVAGFSLAGLPLTAGFTTRLAVLRGLGVLRLEWIIALGLTSLGPAWVFARCAIAALGPGGEGADRREAFVPALLTLVLAATLLVLGVAPEVLRLLPVPWLESLPFASTPLFTN